MKTFGRQLEAMKFSVWDFLLSFLVFNLHASLTTKPVDALLITALNVPPIADVRDTISLSCSYNLGGDKLNSVKWYKDGREFFRYAPTMENPIMTFQVDGIHITKDPYDDCGRTRCRVTLDNLSVQSTGTYRCEVSGDAPTFHITYETSNMTIIALPRHDPIISGLGYRYEIGDFVVANCSSDHSYPPAVLSWYINDMKVPMEFVQPQRERIDVQDGFQLYVRSLEIRFRLEKMLFNENNARAKLKCVAKIKEMPTAIRESVVTIFVPSMDQLSNQKLINWRGSSDAIKHRSCVSLVLVLASMAHFVSKQDNL